jgi:hypothetical protein
VVAQTFGHGDQEQASQDMLGFRSADYHSSVTIFLLLVSQPTGDEERAVWLHPHPGGLLYKELEGGMKNSKATDFAQALQR